MKYLSSFSFVQFSLCSTIVFINHGGSYKVYFKYFWFVLYINIFVFIVSYLHTNYYYTLILAEYFALPTSVNATDSATIKEFIENVDNTILVGVAGNDERLHFLHHIPTDESSLIFYKISNGRNGSSAALESLPPLGMLTLDGGLVKSIYYSLQRVYSPNVTKVCSCPRTPSLFDPLIANDL